MVIYSYFYRMPSGFRILLLAALISFKAAAQITVFEQSGGNASAAYEEVVSYYKKLDQRYNTIRMAEAGPTDVIHPLHVVYYSADSGFNELQWKQQGKLIILINNGIHPGEPDGIDASMMLLRDAASGTIRVPEEIVLAVIPVFNIGGALNRGSFSRANQNGPVAYGFRGNAQNLDLNRDFIKMDARETQSLVRLFRWLDPDIFIDNHVSNGADYQHLMTLLSVNPAKQGDTMGQFLKSVLEPAVYESMAGKGLELVPYVNHWGNTPDSGWHQFYEPPRFASGYASLFQTYAFVPETHMLKPYKQRVEATYALMESFIQIAGKHAARIRETREKERTALRAKASFVIDWKPDTGYTLIRFKGYEAAYKPSLVSGLPRLYYDRTKPYTKMVRFYDRLKPSAVAAAPKAYIIPQGWHKVIERLQLNNVAMQPLERDTVITVTVYRIDSFGTRSQPYEGHYLHHNVQFRRTTEKIRFNRGDYLIPFRQPSCRYLAETLEPNAPDAFFAWGFFDAVLQQKEYFSDYVFEDEAVKLLQSDPQLKKLLDDEKKKDKAFAGDARSQLDFIYRHSPYYEPGHLRYPVYRID